MNRIRSIAIALTAVLTLNGAKTYHRYADQKEIHEPFGHISKEQILARSEPILNALSPGGDGLTPSALRASTTEDNPANRKFWIVDGFNTDRNSQVCLVWDAASGELQSVTVDRGERPDSVAEPTSVKLGHRTLKLKDAIRISGSWITSLGIDRETGTWHYSNKVVKNHSSWYLLWTCGSHRMEVAINPTNGELLRAFTVGPAGDDPRIGMVRAARRTPVM